MASLHDSRFALYPGADHLGLRSALLTLVKKPGFSRPAVTYWRLLRCVPLKRGNEYHVMESNYLCLRYSPDARHGNNKK